MVKKILNEIKKLQNNQAIKKQINERLKEFNSFKNKSEEEWFSELCYCILTANSKAETALKIEAELKGRGFLKNNEDIIKNTIIKHKHRFHNNKTKYIITARQFKDIKNITNNMVKEKGELKTRDFIAENIKGLGYKEASHFLRNVGYTKISILDRHILNLLSENKIINDKPKTLTKKIYYEIEQKFTKLAKKTEMNLAELDLYLWYMKTGKILK